MVKQRGKLNINPNVQFENKYQEYKNYLDNIVIGSYGLLILLVSVYIIVLMKIDVGSTMNYFVSLLFTNFFPILLGIDIIVIAISTPLNSFIFKEPMIDEWVPDIALRTLNTEVIIYQRDKLFFSYDVMSDSRTIKNFILDINARSEIYNYYLLAIDRNNALFSLIVRDKINIPTFIENEHVYDKDNMIYLGVIEDKKDIDDFVWNYNDKDSKDYSNALVAFGEQGSGKKNFSNIIIDSLSHKNSQIININTEHFDKNYKKINNINSIATDIKDSKSIFNSIQNYLYYKINNKNDNNMVDYYDIAGMHLQYDTLININVDGIFQIKMVFEVYDMLKEGKNVELLEVL